MTKSQLIKTIHQNSEYRYVDVENIVNQVFDVITNALLEDDKVVVSNFGTFEKYHQASYVGVNPSTGERITIEGTNKVRFIASRKVKDIMNK